MSAYATHCTIFYKTNAKNDRIWFFECQPLGEKQSERKMWRERERVKSNTKIHFISHSNTPDSLELCPTCLLCSIAIVSRHHQRHTGWLHVSLVLSNSLSLTHSLTIARLAICNNLFHSFFCYVLIECYHHHHEFGHGFTGPKPRSASQENKEQKM